MSRRAASRGKDDRNQPAIRQAIELLGFPVVDLSGVGGGCEDLLVGVRKSVYEDDEVICFWLLVECKVPPVRYTAAQRKWREKTCLWPRITATSGQDAVDQLRAMTGVAAPSSACRTSAR